MPETEVVTLGAAWVAARIEHVPAAAQARASAHWRSRAYACAACAAKIADAPVDWWEGKL